jgi:hypothetical protein
MGRFKNALREWIEPTPAARPDTSTLPDLPLAAPLVIYSEPLPTHAIAAREQQPVERATFKQRATAIAEQYRSELPADYIGKHAALAQSDVLETLFRAVSAGLNQRDSCAAAGISPDTFQRWMKMADAEPDGAHAVLAADLKAARAAGKLAHLENIKKHSAKEWTASAWTLERTDPEQFGKRDADSSQPKVVVQIGVRDGDVQVALSPAVPVVQSEGQQNR